MSFFIVTVCMLVVSIIVLSVSTYGLGKEENNKMGEGYKTATVSTGISSGVVVLSILIIILLSYLNVKKIRVMTPAIPPIQA